MAESKRILYRIFKKLSEDEQQAFFRFLEAMEPQEELRGIALGMLKHEMTEIAIWKEIFPQSPYNDTYFRRQLEKLMLRLEDFLAWRALQENQSLKKSLFIRRLAEQNVLKEDGFDTRFRKVLRQLRSTGFKHADQLEAEALVLKYGIQMRMDTELKQAIDNKQSPALLEEQALIIRMLYRFCIQPVYEQFGEMSSYLLEMQSIESWLAQIKKNQGLMANPFLTFLWYFAEFIFTSKGDARFLVHELMEIRHIIQKDEFTTLFFVLQGQLIKIVNQEGESKLFPVLLQLYEEGMEKRIFFVNGFLEISHYNNFTQLHYLSLRQQSPDDRNQEQKAYILDYLKRNKAYLHPDFAESLYHMNRARILFAFGEYQAINVHLRAWNFPTPIMAVNYQLTVCQALYERKAYPEIIRKFTSLKAYLTAQQSIRPQARKKYEHRIRWLLKLCQLRVLKVGKSARKERLFKLAEKIKAQALPTDKAWLLAKIQDYQKELG